MFILADNVGYGDVGPYGGGELRGAPTPRTGQLASQGLRLTQFLVEPSCSPSRAALMTAQYSIRNGLSLALVPGTPNTLPGKAYTLPTDRPIDGIDQSSVLFGTSEATGPRESLLTFSGPDMVAVRWKQWRLYFKDMHLSGSDHQKLGDVFRNILEQRPDPKPEALQRTRELMKQAVPDCLVTIGTSSPPRSKRARKRSSCPL